MDLLGQLMKQLGQPAPQQRGGQPAPAGAQKQFKMYEDQSFQGDPRQFIQQNPGFKFYEDGSFAPPQARPQQKPFQMYEDGSYQGNPQAYKATNPATKFYEDGSFRAPGPQVQRDPIADLRKLLGF
jgi:hypothetical protein